LGLNTESVALIWRPHSSDEIFTDQPLVPIVTLAANFNRWKRAIFSQLIRGLLFWAGGNVAL
jgi:hypothetical protein